MRILLSTIGSRGDVQPFVAPALELRALGQEPHLCVPPDFVEWIASFDLPVTAIGPTLQPASRANGDAVPSTARATATTSPQTPNTFTSMSPEQRAQLIEATVIAQFAVLGRVARDCDVIVGATALQIAAPSIAETLGIPYTFVSYCPAVLPSTHHAPPVLALHGDASVASPDEYAARWNRDGERFNATFRSALNAQRHELALPPIDDVRSHVLTPQPWLAADRVLAPWPSADDDVRVWQPGAWMLQDRRVLPREVESFLSDGDAPVYFGFGSMASMPNIAEVLLQTARAVGQRAIILRGWAGLSIVDASLRDHDRDVLFVDEVNQQELFKHVAAVVHHGGAGTTTVAARAGAPQVVIPQMYDQHYFATRVHELGIGIAHAPGIPTVQSLTVALDAVLKGDCSVRAAAVARGIRTDGAQLAAQRVLEFRA